VTELSTKVQMLEDAGYRYSLDRRIFVNRDRRKVFSFEFVEDNSVEELERELLRENVEDGWQFIFNGTPSSSVKRELTALLNA
jgi:thermostable 8-oxoguanine DNA glycosylase